MSPFTNREQGHLTRIEERCEVLKARLKSAVGGTALHITQELRALGWAVDTITLLRQDDEETARPEALRIPDGWKLVPEAPTEEMAIACGMVLAMDDVAIAWRNMLACAPSPLAENP